MSLEDMAAKGQRKLEAKRGQMSENYKASLSRAQENFGKVGFGPRTTQAYRTGVQAGAQDYDSGVSRGIGKWRNNWISRVSQ